ncbi:MAG TPA: DUF5069 domain-containing protein [Lacunisphaera sp.]
MPAVPGLRSPYAKIGRLVYFGRMLDKIRLHAAGKLPPEYVANLGDQAAPNFFDARCCRFLGVTHAALTARTLAGGSDEEILAWAHEHGTKRTDEECEIWNTFMTKRGWRDAGSELVKQRSVQFGLTGKSPQTMFEVLDYDEGRDPAAERPWEKI